MTMSEKQIVRNVTFQQEDVAVDGKQFEGCTFTNTALVYGGGPKPAFVNCQFNDVSLEFADNATNTLRYLNGLNQGGFARAVSKIFENIRQGLM
jgi:hypothetical protein